MCDEFERFGEDGKEELLIKPETSRKRDLTVEEGVKETK